MQIPEKYMLNCFKKYKLFLWIADSIKEIHTILFRKNLQTIFCIADIRKINTKLVRKNHILQIIFYEYACAFC